MAITDEKRQKQNAAIFARFRENFGDIKDAELGRILGKCKQAVYNLKGGRDNLNIIYYSSIYPKFDWNYILLGDKPQMIVNQEIPVELRNVRKSMIEAQNALNLIANKLQNIDDKIVK